MYTRYCTIDRKTAGLPCRRSDMLHLRQPPYAHTQAKLAKNKPLSLSLSWLFKESGPLMLTSTGTMAGTGVPKPNLLYRSCRFELYRLLVPIKSSSGRYSQLKLVTSIRKIGVISNFDSVSKDVTLLPTI